MKALSVVAACALSVGCYSPHLADRQFTCEQDGGCPSGFACQCGVCRLPGIDAGACASSADAGAADLAGVDAGPLVSPCTNGNQSRAMGDPGLADLALCPAAWALPGIFGTTTPCNRMPGMNGTGGTNGTTKCSAEDNCLGGWHVCDSESELTQRGFGKTQCGNIGLGGGAVFFATRQRAAPPMPGGTPGPPTCTSAEQHVVMGCGTFGAVPASDCQIVNRGLVNPPTGGDQCSDDSGGTWKCTGTSANMFEGSVIVKGALDKGGVFCCRDN